MKIVKWLGGILGLYALLVAIFEIGYLGYTQPSFEDSEIPMLVLTTTTEAGETKDTILARITVDEKIYVSAHHWSRGAGMQTLWRTPRSWSPSRVKNLSAELCPYKALNLKKQRVRCH